MRCDPVVVLCSCGDNNVLLVEMRICRSTQEAVFRMYRPLLIKNAMEQNVFEEDLYQEFSATLLSCIRKFRV